MFKASEHYWLVNGGKNNRKENKGESKTPLMLRNKETEEDTPLVSVIV